MSLGIDVSRYQGAIDFHAVKASGISLVIAKQGGADSGLYMDRNYLTYRADARAAGLPFGSYFFNGPAASPTTAADYLWDRMDYRPGDLAVIDVEGAGIAWSPAEALAFVNQMIAHGIPPAAVGVYMSASPERTQDWSAVAATGCFLWVASYGNNSGTPGTPPISRWWPAWSLWQHTSNGSVDGIAGRVDMSQIAPGWTPYLPPKTKKKEDIMPQRFMKGSTGTGGTGTLLALAGFLGAPGPNNWDEYRRDDANDGGRAPFEFTAYGAPEVLSDTEWARRKALYVTPAAVGTVTVESDPALLDAVTANSALLSELLAATKALNPPG